MRHIKYYNIHENLPFIKIVEFIKLYNETTIGVCPVRYFRRDIKYNIVERHSFIHCFFRPDDSITIIANSHIEELLSSANVKIIEKYLKCKVCDLSDFDINLFRDTAYTSTYFADILVELVARYMSIDEVAENKDEREVFRRRVATLNSLLANGPTSLLQQRYLDARL